MWEKYYFLGGGGRLGGGVFLGGDGGGGGVGHGKGGRKRGVEQCIRSSVHRTMLPR